MQLSKEQLLNDFSLLAKSNIEIMEKENIIRNNVKAIDEYVQKV